MSQLFTSGGQSIGVSASTSVLPMIIQDWFHLEWIGWVFLQKNLLQHHNWRASILWCSAFFIVQLSHPYLTIGYSSWGDRVAQDWAAEHERILHNRSLLFICFIYSSVYMLIPNSIFLSPHPCPALCNTLITSLAILYILLPAFLLRHRYWWLCYYPVQ